MKTFHSFKSPLLSGLFGLYCFCLCYNYFMKNVVVATNLHKHYGSFHALRGVSFTIGEGECFGLLGHNGAGKSTTMKMIYGLSTVDEGTLTIFDQSISLTPPSVKQRLGVVPQEDNLDPDLSVLENLEVYAGLFGFNRHQAQKTSQEMLSFMGLESKEHNPVDTLSGGQKRRLIIARALLNRPSLLLLDEPTTGLDPQGRHLVWQKLRALKSEGVTLILTTHYMEEASQLCDRLIIMHEGLVLTEGTPSELICANVLPYVIEIRSPLDTIPADIAEKVRQFGGETLQVMDGLFLYANDGNSLWQRINEWGLPQHSCFLRRSSLEDVFLKLTGRGTEE
jgi:lipooligosaccharide transport system ATP-binding protein